MIALTLAEMVPLLDGEVLGPDVRIGSVGIDSRQLEVLRQALTATEAKPTLLIKGSRSMQMERIVQALRRTADATREAQP